MKRQKIKRIAAASKDASRLKESLPTQILRSNSLPEKSKTAPCVVLNTLTLHRCKTCKGTFDTATFLNAHKLLRHSSMTRRKTFCDSPMKPWNKKDSYRCKWCQKIFITPAMLLAHMHLKHQDVDADPDKYKTQVQDTDKYKTQELMALSHDEDDMSLSERIASKVDKIVTYTARKPHKCPLCSAAFALKSYWMWHVKNAHGESYKGDSQFQIDGVTVISDSSVSGAIAENVQIDEKEYIVPVVLEDAYGENEPFRCVCGSAFQLKEELAKHMVAHGDHLQHSDSNQDLDWSSTNQKPFVCNLCSGIFSLQTQYEEHSVACAQSDRISVQDANSGNVPLVCNAHCSTIQTQMEHAHLVGEFPEATTQGVEAMLSDIDQKPLICKTCYEVFPHQIEFEGHKVACVRDDSYRSEITATVDQKPFLCATCGDIFLFNEQLESHKSTCRHSDAQFNDELLLLDVHSVDQKPFLCTTCGDIFSLQIQFEAHKTSCGQNDTQFGDAQGVDEKPFLCACGNIFVLQIQFDEHKALCPHNVESYDAASNGDQKPFRCEKCGATFPFKASLDEHSTIHTESEILGL